MNANAWAGQLAAPLAVAVGILICFWGYRILKLSLGIIGFIAGAVGGWQIGLSLVPSSNAIALVCAILGALVGAVLCVWLFFLGIFLLGASAGTITASALFSTAGHQPHPILLLACAIAFGIVALLIQKLMIIVSTTFSGAYLITAGILHLLTGGQNSLPLWFDYSHSSSAGLLGFVVLGCWLVLGLAGVGFQYRGSRRRDEAARHEVQPA
ncbi:MAG TPA: DUF4203 domain-containing protein [Candidatus Sulfotelmatobacter sp.]|nr:DUF4203 domain-containing protein [Candidatus Sulfotelmatobacter sp.]HWI55763.1 DUF4203 domain-containing protein [Bacillota bacterium]